MYAKGRALPLMIQVLELRVCKFGFQVRVQGVGPRVLGCIWKAGQMMQGLER